ncbi:DUF1045 domain-containing protein [Cochlodiniinecator piscidefendens]|uniref:DUF1045 domain-containing protein n=1 Tax=Cochlodiniinecator piscidefendens TaxID=2715756 RepID=UPI0014095B01|nr:DUF1045 domain-containing protein [Cochlodiniinecator piscidefendens]
MKKFKRFAVYYAPEPGAFADFAAAWLGWNATLGRSVDMPVLPKLPIAWEQIISTPSKYGFHGTIKPPFYLAEGCTLGQLETDLALLADRLSSVELPRLALQRPGGFLALVPKGDTAALSQLAADVVQSLDHYRRPASPEELLRRRAAGLTQTQDENLVRWGYPYVFQDFQFHLTLSNRLSNDIAEAICKILEPALLPLLPRPFAMRDLCLFGEDKMTGRFHLLHRYLLTGANASTTA